MCILSEYQVCFISNIVVKDLISTYENQLRVTKCVRSICPAFFALDPATASDACALDFTGIGQDTNNVNSTVELKENIPYEVAVRATNLAGLSNTTKSLTFVVDVTQPDTLKANVTIFTPIHPQWLPNFHIDAKWSGFLDAVSPRLAYDWCLGTCSSASGGEEVQDCDLLAWRRNGLNLTLRENLTPEHLKKTSSRFCLFVRAVDGAGNHAKHVSNVVHVDTTKPEFSGSVLDGERVVCEDETGCGESDISFASGGPDSKMAVHFDEFVDEESGIYRYDACLTNRLPDFDGGCRDDIKLNACRKLIDCNVVRWTDIGTKTNHAWMNVVDDASSGSVEETLNLKDGTNVYACVSAVNNAGNTYEVCSNGVLIDSSPPLAGDVTVTGKYVVSGNDGRQYVTKLNKINVEWSAFNESACNDCVHYEIAMCSTPTRGGLDCTAFPWTPYYPDGSNVRVMNLALELEDVVVGKEYFVKVKAINIAGLNTVVVRGPVVFDDTAPVIKTFNLLSQGLDPHYQSSWDVVEARWRSVTDDQSPIKSYTFCLGSKSPTTYSFSQNVVKCTALGDSVGSISVVDNGEEKPAGFPCNHILLACDTPIPETPKKYKQLKFISFQHSSPMVSDVCTSN